MSETAAATSGATADLWQNLLRETAAKAKIKDSTLFVLGDRCSGKNSLLRSLRFKHDFHADSNTHHFPEALAYSYFTLFDPEDPDSDNMGLPTKVNVWTLGNVAYKSLLNTAICNGDLEHTTIAIIVNLSKPYNVLAELHKWLEVVEGTFKEPFSNLPLEKQAFLKEKIQSLFNAKSSTETGDDAESKADSNEKMAEQTGESNTIKIETNLGVSIIVIGSMSDHLLDQRAKSRLSADQCDFLQMHLRRVCLKYGAALCYTSSVRGSTNNSLLQKYLLHRMYPTQYTFGENAEVIQRDSIFVPAGWDTQSHINEIVDKASKISIDAAFNDVITFPSDAELTTNVPRSHAPLQPSLKALEYQAFLKTLGTPTSGSKSRSERSIKRIKSTPHTPSSSSTGSTVPASPGNADDVEPDHSLLKNFFRGLMNRSGGDRGGSGSGSSSGNSLKDRKVKAKARDELKRMNGLSK